MIIYQIGNKELKLIILIVYCRRLYSEYLKVWCNSGKCHLVLGTDEPAEMQMGESLIKCANCEKLLSVKIKSRLTFDKHIKTVCRYKVTN